MKKYVLTVLTALVLAAGVIGHVSADSGAEKSAAELAVLLPESDLVMTMDAGRFLDQALPQILSANRSMLDKVNGEIERIKTRTGLDLREFRQVAVGIRSRQVSATETDFEPVVLARGTINAKMLVSVVKLASNGKYRTETIGGRTVYIFSPKEVIEENRDKLGGGGNTLADKALAKMSRSFSKEIAMAAFDTNTLVFGMPERVRETVGNSPRISNEVLSLLNRNPGAIINFGARTSAGLSKFLPLDNDELGRDLDAIRQVQGSMDVAAGNTIFSVFAKTEQTAQAESLEGNLQALQTVFSRLLMGMKGDDKQIYGRTLANMEIARRDNEVSIDLSIPQADIDRIIGK